MGSPCIFFNPLMKKFTILLASAFLYSMHAYADDLSVGYCDGGNVETAVSGAASVAIRLPAQDFPMYEGTSIIGVRVGLMCDAMKGVDIFLRHDLSGEDLLRFHSGALYKGWSDILFDSPMNWSEGDICVGYDLSSNLEAGLSHVGSLTTVPESMWALVNDKWIDLSPDGFMPLCIQLLIDGSSYHKNDVDLIAAEDVVAETGKPFEITGLLRNNTVNILNSVRLSCDWGEGIKEGDAYTEEILPGEIGLFRLPMPEIELSGNAEALLEVVSIAGEPDDYSFNNSATVAVTAVESMIPRKVLIEEFTGQRCPNCPAGQSRVAEGIKALDNVVLISHHIGFGADALTARGSNDLLYFYGRNDGSSYAPAIMFDRTPTSGEPGPVTTIPESKSITERIVERQKTGAPVIIGIDPIYDVASRELNINVSLKHIKGMSVGGNPVLTVALIENGIIAFQAPAYDEYEHNEAVRQFLTSPLGDRITLSSEEPATYSYTVTINEEFNASNMEIVAFVSNYDSVSPNNCEVYNTEVASVMGESGLETISDTNVTETIYDLSGRLLDSLQPGINIIRRSDGRTRKVIVRN